MIIQCIYPQDVPPGQKHPSFITVVFRIPAEHFMGNEFPTVISCFPSKRIVPGTK